VQERDEKKNEVLWLRDLADPERTPFRTDVGDLTPEIAAGYLERMYEIRFAEELIGRWVTEGVVGTPCHLGIGQEACAVGICSELQRSDRVFGNHRSHAHYLALGGSLTGLFSEVLGRKTGASRGMGGSMHLYDANAGFHGSVPIVAATISIAVGAALAAKMDGNGAIAVTFFGDGAIEEGVLHESLNLASSQALPVLFVCENNLFSSHLDIELRQPGNRTARFADAHGIAAESVNGNDVSQVAISAREAIARIRGSSAPAFLELVTYRHRGHVGPKEDIDVGVHRTMSELEAWKKYDPIQMFVAFVLSNKLLNEGAIQRIAGEMRERVGSAAEKSLKDPYPDDHQLLGMVYAGGGA
jgi:acetoin:2,6-dichlorophenolindophenol oxidoreductase subunit alpha